MENSDKAITAFADQQKQIIQGLASTYEEKEKKEIIRDVFVVLNLKTTTDRGSSTPRKLTAYEAFSHVVCCRDLQLNPKLNHIEVLEGKNYITLDGHLHTAHISGSLVWLKTEIVKEDPVKKYYRYRCIVVRLIGDREVTFEAEGVGSPETIRKKFLTTLFIEQMAEARAMRRCLKRAFPLGMPHSEDREIMTPEIGLGFPEKSHDDAATYIQRIDAAKNEKDLIEISKELPPLISTFSDEAKKKIAKKIKEKKKIFNSDKEVKIDTEETPKVTEYPATGGNGGNGGSGGSGEDEINVGSGEDGASSNLKPTKKKGEKEFKDMTLSEYLNLIEHGIHTIKTLQVNIRECDRARKLDKHLWTDEEYQKIQKAFEETFHRISEKGDY